MRLFNHTSDIGYFLAGLGAGAVVALLFAPNSGRHSRRFLVRKAENGWSHLAATQRELRDQALDMVERGKGLAAKIVQ
jgi:gas vesicle protein